MARGEGQERRTYGQWWGSTEEMVAVPLASVRRVGLAGLEAGGASPDDAAFLLDIRLDKAFQGDHARGLAGLPGMARAASRGELDLHPQIEVVRDRASAALVDGGPRAAAALVCRFAMEMAIQKARQHGTGWVSARAAGEILTPFVKHAAAQDMVAMMMIQSYPTVAPTGGIAPILGNAPVAFGIPATRHAPVILDMSLTETSASGVHLAARQGQQVSEGFILDERGEPTTDAREFPNLEWMERGIPVARGSLLPMGGGHKGYALVFVVGLLGALLSDTSPPWDLAFDLPQRGRSGSLILAIDPATFLPIQEFKARVDQFIDHVKASPRRPGVSEILYPGEGSQQLQREGKASGLISMPASHYHGLVSLAKELGMEGAI